MKDRKIQNTEVTIDGISTVKKSRLKSLLHSAMNPIYIKILIFMLCVAVISNIQIVKNKIESINFKTLEASPDPIKILKDCPESFRLPPDKKIHLITSIIFYPDPIYKNSLVYKGGSSPTAHQTNIRMKELLYTLQLNLNDTNVGSIHLLQETQSAVDFIKRQNLHNKDKLFIYANKQASLVDSLDFAFQCLAERFVLFINQDISLGKGWEKINVNAIREGKIGYVMTRHQSLRCPSNYGTCSHNSPITSAHDAFAFYSKLNYVKADKKILDGVTPKHYGMENLLAWWMKDILKLRLMNPCLTLILRHEHCIPLRVTGRDRVNQKHSFYVSYTDKLT